MALIESWFNQELLEPVKVHYLDGNYFSQDNNGNLVGVNVLDEGEPASISGTVSASVIRADGATVAVSGVRNGNQCYVILPQACYMVAGALSIVIKLTSGSTVTSLCAVVANVYQSSTDTVVDPSTIIPSIQTLINEIDTAIASIPADYSSLWTSLAPAFNANKTGGYKAGEYVTYNGVLYKFTSDHSGSWSSSDVTAVDLGSALYTHSTQISELISEVNPNRSVQFLCGNVWSFDFNTMTFTVPATTDVMLDGKSVGTISAGSIVLTPDGSGKKQMIVFNRTNRTLSLVAVTASALSSNLVVVGHLYMGTSYRFNVIYFSPCELEVSNGNTELYNYLKDIHLEPKQVIVTKNTSTTRISFPYSTRVWLGRRLINTISAGTNMNITPADEYDIQTLVYNLTNNVVKIDNNASLMDFDNVVIGYYIVSTMQFLTPFEVIVENVPEIPAQNIIDLGKARFNTAVANLTDCGLLISLMSDAHYQGYSSSITKCIDSFKLLNFINNEPCIDMCVNLGDLITVDGDTTRAMAVGFAMDALGQLDSEKLRSIIGNHDINAKHETSGSIDYAQQLSKTDQYNIFCKCPTNQTGKCYWYEDIDRAKIRVYFSDSYQYAQGERQYWDSEQVSFFENTVIGTLPTGYKIILFIHSGNVSATGNFGSTVAPIIASNANKFACIVHGHLHSDKIETFVVNDTDTGIPYICINSTYRNVQNLNDPILGTVNMLTVTLLGISKDLSTIYLNRIGYGVDNNGDSDNNFERTISRSYT